MFYNKSILLIRRQNQKRPTLTLKLKSKEKEIFAGLKEVKVSINQKKYAFVHVIHIEIIKQMRGWAFCREGSETTAALFGGDFFFYQFHRDTRLSELIGDTVLVKSTHDETGGEIIKQMNNRGGILTCDMCVLDDISRAPGDKKEEEAQNNIFLPSPSEALNILLRLLNERKFQGESIPLLTAIATGNPSSDESYYNEPLDPANLDRFVLQVESKSLIQDHNWEDALQLMDDFGDLTTTTSSGFLKENDKLNEEEVEEKDYDDRKMQQQQQQQMNLDLLRDSQKLASYVHVPIKVKRLLLSFIQALENDDRVQDHNHILSDRTMLVKTVKVLKAHALLNGRMHVTPEDLKVLSLITTYRVPPEVHKEVPLLINALLETLKDREEDEEEEEEEEKKIEQEGNNNMKTEEEEKKKKKEGENAGDGNADMLMLLDCFDLNEIAAAGNEGTDGKEGGEEDGNPHNNNNVEEKEEEYRVKSQEQEEVMEDSSLSSSSSSSSAAPRLTIDFDILEKHNKEGANQEQEQQQQTGSRSLQKMIDFILNKTQQDYKMNDSMNSGKNDGDEKEGTDANNPLDDEETTTAADKEKDDDKENGHIRQWPNPYTATKSLEEQYESSSSQIENMDLLLNALSGRMQRAKVTGGPSSSGVPRKWKPSRSFVSDFTICNESTNENDNIFISDMEDSEPAEMANWVANPMPTLPRSMESSRHSYRKKEYYIIINNKQQQKEAEAAAIVAVADRVIQRLIHIAKKNWMRVGYIEFNHQSKKYTPKGQFFSRDHDKVCELAAALHCDGYTNYQDPLKDALMEFENLTPQKNPRSRMYSSTSSSSSSSSSSLSSSSINSGSSKKPNRHILFLTDGLPNQGDCRVTVERQLAHALGVAVHTVFIGYQRSPPVLDLLSNDTKGERFRAVRSGSSIRVEHR
eukprot:jgi/Bigna1/130919/aug1.12_g5627